MPLVGIMVFLLLLSSKRCECLQRKISGEQAPGRGNSKIEFYYVRAAGTEDTMHYVWDFTEKPSLLVSNTKNDSEFNVNWNKYDSTECEKAINFSHNVSYSFVLIIDQIIEFDDINDVGALTPQLRNISYPTTHFSWKIMQPFSISPDFSFATLTAIGSNFAALNSSLNGSIIIELSTFGAKSHDLELPRLLHSANSTQVKVAFKDLKSNSQFNNSRWAVGFTYISTDSKSNISSVQMSRNLDDENSPGVFSVINLLTPQAENNAYHGAYLQWRPIVYTSEVASIGNSTDATVYDPTNVTDPISTLNCSLALKLFGDKVSSLLVRHAVVSFGSSQDGFYKKTNFTSWAFLVTYGSPELEQFSLFIVLVISIGIGLPTALIIIGAVFMCTRRFRRRGDELSFDR